MTHVEPATAVGAVKVLDAGEYALIFSRDDLSLRLLPLEGAAPPGDEPPLLEHLAEELLQDQPQRRFQPKQPTEPQAPEDPRPAIDRLTLTVSNTCNLGCSYCYASQGTYYNKPGLMMTKDTAFNAINQAARAYSRIEHINFFGGEPTLNPEIIELACEYVRYLHGRGVLTNLPTFGITTNGYVLNDRMLEVLTGYQFTVTLSLDGPREIHDLKRPTKAGKGSYDAVARNAKKLLANGLDVEFECTYTADHHKLGLDLVGLLDFFADEFGCRVLHCPIVAAAPDSEEAIPLSTCLQLQGDAIEASILNLARGIPRASSLAVRMMDSLIHHTPIWNYCPAGRSEITVNADGNVYACFMLMQSPDYSFGSVNPARQSGAQGLPLRMLEQPGNVGSKHGHIEQFIAAADKYTNHACRRCWAQPLCHGCLGEDFERTRGGGVLRSEVPGVSAFCDYKRGLVERFLRALAQAYQIIGVRVD